MAFSEHLRILATEQIENKIVVTKDILSGGQWLHHPNGGTTDKKGYHPPKKVTSITTDSVNSLLFYRDGLCQISRLVNISSLEYCHVVGK